MTAWKSDILTETFHILDTTGAWQEMEMPAGVFAKTILIQVHTPNDAVYDPDVGTYPFLFSHDETKGWSIIPKYGLMVNIRNSGRISLKGIIGKIKADAGAKVSIMVTN